MTASEVEAGAIFECRVSHRLAPVKIEEVLPTGLKGINLDTKREVFIKWADMTRRFRAAITDMNEGRLHNGGGRG